MSVAFGRLGRSTEDAMLASQPFVHCLKNLAGMRSPSVEEVAVDRWTISPPVKRLIRPATFLRNQLDRIKGVKFATFAEIRKGFQGDYETIEPATSGYRLVDADLIDGVLYRGNARKCLRPRLRSVPVYVRPSTATKGVLYESWMGNRWFGNWLSDDCLTYLLAEHYGGAITTKAMNSAHEPQYARKLCVSARLVADVHFDELIVFSDEGHNANKKQRADQTRARLVASHLPIVEHPGVFILRGGSGDLRMLRDEFALASRFASEYGFIILDPSRATVDQIIDACAGARIVAGVEGSHLVHGLAVMPSHATLFVIQPPERVVSALKIVTDRQEQSYAFVVGEGGRNEFTTPWPDIDRTMHMVFK